MIYISVIFQHIFQDTKMLNNTIITTTVNRAVTSTWVRVGFDVCLGTEICNRVPVKIAACPSLAVSRVTEK